MSLGEELEKAAEGLIPEVAIAAMSAFTKVPVWLVTDAINLLEKIAGAKSPSEALALADQAIITTAANVATDAALGLDPETKREG